MDGLAFCTTDLSKAILDAPQSLRREMASLERILGWSFVDAAVQLCSRGTQADA